MAAKLPPHKLSNEEKKPFVVFEFENLDDRDKAKSILEVCGDHYTCGKTLVSFRLSGNVDWGVPFPKCEGLKDLTFWVWTESNIYFYAIAQTGLFTGLRVPKGETPDMVLEDGNLITNVFNRLIRTCFYAIQKDFGGKIPGGEVSERIRIIAEKAVLDYER